MTKHEKNQNGHMDKDLGQNQKNAQNKEHVSPKSDSAKHGSSKEESALDKSNTKMGKNIGDASDYGKEETSRDKNNKKW